MQTVLHSPVSAHRSGQALRPRTQATDEISHFGLGPYPLSDYAALLKVAGTVGGCGVGIGTAAGVFNSAVMFGDCQCHSNRRSLAKLAVMSPNVAFQRPLRARPRICNIPSAFSSSQKTLLPFKRRLITRRMALSIAPLPIGKPRRR